MASPLSKLAGRYRFSKRRGAKGSTTWVAVDERDDREVIASALPMARLAALEGTVGLKHAHLATIVDVVHDPSADELPAEARGPKFAGVAVAELVAGQALAEVLKSGPLEPGRAVEVIAATCAAVATLHRAGGVHGAISPRNVVLEPEGGRKGPVLAHFVANASGAYCSLERVNGGGPSPEDDVWALFALLQAALVGRPPFEAKTRAELADKIVQGTAKRLRSVGIEDDALQKIIDDGFASASAQRTRSLSGLEKALEAWQRAKAPAAPPAPAKAAKEPPAVPSLVDPDDDEDAETQMFNASDVADALAALDDDSAIPPSEDAEEDADEATQVIQNPLEHAALLDGLGAGAAPEEPSKETEPDEVPLPSFSDPDAPPPSVGASPFKSDVSLGSVPQPGAFPPPPAPDSAEPPPSSPPSSQRGAFQVPGGEQEAHIPVRSLDPPAPDSAPVPSSAPAPPSAAFTAPSSAPARPASVPAAKRRGLNRVLLVIAVLLAIAVAASGAMLYLKEKKKADTERKARAVPPPASAQPARPAPPASAPVEKPSKPVSAEERTECVRAFFPSETFKGSEDFDFVCDDKDFRGINSLLYRRIVVAGTGKITPGMEEWSKLGWFELGVTATVRHACCPASTPRIRLPKTVGPCVGMADLLDGLGTSKRSPSDEARHFASTIKCYYANGVPRPYEYKKLTGHSRETFAMFLERNRPRRR